MRPIYMTIAAVAALSLAAPASAQWGHDRTYSHKLQVQIDSGVRQGAISRDESFGLSDDLGRLVRLERRFSPNGISGREHSVLMQRSTLLAKAIRIASRSHQAAAWDRRTGHYEIIGDPRFAGPNRGDRYLGDTRIGQRATARIVTMPVEYRNEHVDTNRVYHGYDDGRVYQIERQSQMILALLDIMR